MVGGKTKYLGTYRTPELAARAYDKQAVKFGRPLNFPHEFGLIATPDPASQPLCAEIPRTKTDLKAGSPKSPLSQQKSQNSTHPEGKSEPEKSSTIDLECSEIFSPRELDTDAGIHKNVTESAQKPQNLEISQKTQNFEISDSANDSARPMKRARVSIKSDIGDSEFQIKPEEISDVNVEGENVSKKLDPESEYRGVSRNGNGWKADITINGKRIHLGTFLTVEDAARAYDSEAKQIPRRKLNFPGEDSVFPRENQKLMRGGPKAKRNKSGKLTAPENICGKTASLEIEKTPEIGDIVSDKKVPETEFPVPERVQNLYTLTDN